MISHKFDVLIIGGGVNGLSTAYQLSKNKSLKVGLVEQFSLRHRYGSSHGFSRIFRSTYLNPIYVKLAKLAQLSEWPSLEKEAGCKLLHYNNRCVFGEGKSFEKYIETILKNCPDLELLDADFARRLFPQFHFRNSPYVLKDKSAGVIAANDTIENLIKILVNKKVDILENTKVLKIDSESDLIKIDTPTGILKTERLIITAGPWINQFISKWDSQFCPIKQVIGYFKLKGSKKSFQLGQFPVWLYLGEGINNDFYGLPEFGIEGIKIAQEVSSKNRDDPDEKNPKIDPIRIRALEDFISNQFTYSIDRLVSLETCFYTDTPTRDFVLDLFSHDPRIAIGSACSGHAFKFAPLIGRILTELILFGKTTIPEFEDSRELFSLKKLKR